MLALLGLKDSYVTDGRVLTEILKGNALPKSLEKNKATVEKLGAVYKQIMASFGQFSMDTLTASTGALASNSAGDTTYAEHRSCTRGPWRSPRCRWPARSALALWRAEFGGRAINKKAGRRLDQAGERVSSTQAAALAGSFHSPAADQKTLDKINHIVVIYEENHSFDNLYGGWEGVNGLLQRRRGAHHPGQRGRQRLHLPQAERREPAGTGPAGGDLLRLDAGDARRPVREPLHERAVHDRRLHRRRPTRRARRTHCSASQAPAATAGRT